MADGDRPVVLVVEDEPDVAETYERWLQSTYDVRTAASGEEALERVEESVDVVLLDRMMQGISGEAVLEELRERGVDCRVAMVTAVNPDFDVIEMGFDEYVLKPPEREELHDTIERLLDRATLDQELQEYYSLVARKGALQTEKTDDELSASEEYAELLERIESMRASVDADLGDMAADTNFVGAVRQIVDTDESPHGDRTQEGEGE